MGNHRAEVLVDSRPSEETPQPTPYVGKRRASAAAEAAPAEPVEPVEPVEMATPEVAAYVGRRRAAPVGQVDGPALGVPAPRRTVEATPAAGLAVAAPEAAPVIALPDIDVEATAWTDLRIDTGSLPPLNETAVYATDFSAETTTNLPAVPALATGRRRAAPGAPGRTTHPLTKRLPSAPIALGVAALAIAVGGAVTAAHAPSSKASTRFVAATALSGASDVGQVGARSGSAVSRGSDRTSLTDQANEAAEQRAASLSAINNKATAMDKWKAANQWGLPIPSGGYHLTGRFDDVSGLWATVHTGLDFACPTGTPIHAIAGGTITQVGWAGAYGNRTVETLPDGTELWYAHQVRFDATVGEKVTEGEVMGYVGSTGNTTGPHVHIEVRPGGGDPVDPDTALKAHGIDPDANQS